MTNRLELAILGIAALLVPRSEREEWLNEWRAELWYVPRDRATSFVLGAFADALWLCRAGQRESILADPGRCIVVFSVFAACAISLVFLWRDCHELLRIAGARPLVHVVMILLLIPVSAATCPLSYPAVSSVRRRLRWWSFLLTKGILVACLVFLGMLILASVTNTPLQAHGWLVGYFLGFRWILLDQNRRCPVCLCRLISPVRIGSSAATFLEWHGTEYVCAGGHGVLQVPEVPRSYGVPRWLHFDPLPPQRSTI